MYLESPERFSSIPWLEMEFCEIESRQEIPKVGTLFWSKKPPIVLNSFLTALLGKLRAREYIEAIGCSFSTMARLLGSMKGQKCWECLLVSKFWRISDFPNTFWTELITNLGYRKGHFKDSKYLKIQYKFEFWSYEKKSSDLKRSHGIDCWKNNYKFTERVYDS